MRRGSNIRTNATGENVIGGNININTDFLIAVENSDISANSANFRGGNVRINAQGIFGTEIRDVASDRTSDITATGASPELNGTIQLNTPDVDPSRGLVPLPLEVVDATGLIDQNFCAATTGTGSSFTITGRGGLPPSPNSALNSNTVWEDWRFTTVPSSDVWRQAVEDQSANAAKDLSLTTVTPKRATLEPIVEATGWVKNELGEVVLTANSPTVTLHNSWLNPLSCH
ncbi:hypothetical protein [Scytonema sp. NUACC26]|uniref:hypothetical protein n=1 Tax=Scytonema sp. NUACC26 TaxID=3140176 RepID=UPI0034DBD743